MGFIIADSGSTKVDWCAVAADGQVSRVVTGGLNPVHLPQEDIVRRLVAELPEKFRVPGQRIFFYGAGLVSGEVSEKMKRAFEQVFGAGDYSFDSDMKASALALFGTRRGLACILGTGSNTALCENGEILRNVHPGGYILGDEGSGAYIGRRLLSDFIKGLLPEEISRRLKDGYGLDYPGIVDRVYRQPLANRFLASFCPFVAENIEMEYMDRLVRGCFSDFFDRNVSVYRNSGWIDASCPIGCTGSVADAFSAQLHRTAQEKGYRISGILKSPIDGLIEFYR